MDNKLISKYQKRFYLFVAFSLVFVILGIWGYFSQNKKKEDPAVQTQEVKTEKPLEEKPKEAEIKDTASLLVPYTVQAPNANWTVHEESCEEAALLMYHQFLIGDRTENLDSVWVDGQLRAMRSWQLKNYGAETDLSIEKLGQFSKAYYGHSSRVIKNGTVEDIKKEISAGNPILVPVMTHSLNNPHYGRQNTYHILLIKGYDATGVITNDAGVKEGKSYHYVWGTLFSAIDAQTPKMGQGRDFLVLTKN